jgi:hypothetical protein
LGLKDIRDVIAISKSDLSFWLFVLWPKDVVLEPKDVVLRCKTGSADLMAAGLLGWECSHGLEERVSYTLLSGM